MKIGRHALLHIFTPTESTYCNNETEDITKNDNKNINRTNPIKKILLNLYIIERCHGEIRSDVPTRHLYFRINSTSG
jgi:hypothetical protein